jgi:hypothetical protein
LKKETDIHKPLVNVFRKEELLLRGPKYELVITFISHYEIEFLEIYLKGF